MGAPMTPLPPQESVRQMRRFIDTSSAKDSGKIYGFDGREYPW
jgi:hypothetical protein